jgi:hypothetical protein
MSNVVHARGYASGMAVVDLEPEDPEEQQEHVEGADAEPVKGPTYQEMHVIISDFYEQGTLEDLLLHRWGLASRGAWVCWGARLTVLHGVHLPAMELSMGFWTAL